MPALETQLNIRSADFQANAAAMRALVADLQMQVTKSVPPRPRRQRIFDAVSPDIAAVASAFGY